MNAIEAISLLRGQPITIFLMLCAMGGRAGVTELAVNTGYNRKTVSGGLTRLSVFSFVAKMYRYQGWTITSKGKQLFEAILNPGGVNSTLPATSSINLITINKEEKILTTSREEKSTPPPTEIFEVLKDAGIGEPKRTKLSQMNHITPEYVEAHLASGEDLALIIWRMEREYKPPERAQIEYFPCEKCARLTTDKICEDCDG